LIATSRESVESLSECSCTASAISTESMPGGLANPREAKRLIVSISLRWLIAFSRARARFHICASTLAVMPVAAPFTHVRRFDWSAERSDEV
jgi:hypothetical protein